MSKKKLSKKRTVNKQLVSCAVTIKVVPNRRTAIVILSFMGLRLAEIVFEAIFEQPVKDLLSVVMNWIKSILA